MFVSRDARIKHNMFFMVLHSEPVEHKTKKEWGQSGNNERRFAPRSEPRSATRFLSSERLPGVTSETRFAARIRKYEDTFKHIVHHALHHNVLTHHVLHHDLHKESGQKKQRFQHTTSCPRHPPTHTSNTNPDKTEEAPKHVLRVFGTRGLISALERAPPWRLST